MNDVMTLEEIFADPFFEEVVAHVRPVKPERLDPEVDKFLSILDWVRENGREPSQSGNLAEKMLYSRLKGIRGDENRRQICLPYDELGLLGGWDDQL